MPRKPKPAPNPLRDALARGKPLRVKDCKAAATGDLLTWLEQVAVLSRDAPKFGEPPKYLVDTRKRIREEIQRRAD